VFLHDSVLTFSQQFWENLLTSNILSVF